MNKEINLIHGDFTEEIKDISNVDLIITSPPYNIGKEYEKKVCLTKYIEEQKKWISLMVKSLSENGIIAYQVGNYIEDGLVYPIDCLTFNEFIKLGMKPLNRIIWTFGHGAHCRNRLSGRHETILIFSKSKNNTFNLDSIRIPQKYPNKKHYKGPKKGELSGNPLGKNPGDVWEITNVKNNHPEKTKHPCQFPEKLAKKIIMAYSNKNDLVLDPMMGSGTVGKVCIGIRKFIGIEKEKKYYEIAKQRILESEDKQ